MALSIKNSWISDHHDWEDVCSAGIGVLILLSPLSVAPTIAPAIAISVGVAGILITVLVTLQLIMLRRWEQLLKLACGAWVIVAPLVLQYDGTLRILHFVLGGAVVALTLLEFWQDRSCRLAG